MLKQTIIAQIIFCHSSETLNFICYFQQQQQKSETAATTAATAVVAVYYIKTA